MLKWSGDAPIQKGIDAVNGLLQSGRNVYFLTNNSTKSKVAYHTRLAQFGIQVPISKVYSSSYLAALYCHKQLQVKKAYVVGMQGIVDELANH